MKELFSRRNRDKSKDPDFYTYNDFPVAFRNQCYHILSTFIERIENKHFLGNFTGIICEGYAQEKGLKCIPGGYTNCNNMYAIEKYIDNASNEDFLDFLDYIFTNIICNENFSKEAEKYFQFESNPFQNAIDELNLRFVQHNLGYECTNDEIIIKNNAVIHKTIIKPALKMLSDNRFRGAEQEYLTAFDHLRKGNNKDAILNAGKAFESTMKTICKHLKFPYSETDSAKKLVETLKQNNYFPSYLDSYLNNLCALLEEGAPVIRNKESGHGQGSDIKVIDKEYVEFVLNTDASNILFLYRLFESRAKK